MNVQLELWHVISIGLAIVMGFWAMAKVTGSQFQKQLDERFLSQDKASSAQNQQINLRLASIESGNQEEARQWQRVERDMLKWMAEMPVQYVRREDYIRGQSTLEAKLDSLATKFENALLRILNKAP